ncbi:hypothetical protein MKW98_015191 [Papaver atlanticum]|uniref:Uncharacterized protein n=1 Tax=Papaver atlanticum TaxID=357466 RepID=A0AAD4T976_9MAGN|nr:hypothetical protein MKW98_015191 [Papaver atlanticum]
MSDFLEEVLELVFHFLTSQKDRNVVFIVCKSLFGVERRSRQRVSIGNCYSITPQTLINRFPGVKALTSKGKPYFTDVSFDPNVLGGLAYPWIDAMAKSYRGLEEIQLKRMFVSDASLELLSRLFPNFKSIVLIKCEGFTTDGLDEIAANCRSFPHTCTSLVSLNFACLKGEVDRGSLEILVVRCPNLRNLKLNRYVPLARLQRILTLGPHLVDLGIGSYIDTFKTLSGILEVVDRSLPALHPICSDLTFLNLSDAPGIYGSELKTMILRCNKLQRLWILDKIGDDGLEIVATICKELQELRVFPSFAYDGGVTELGLLVVSRRCTKLYSLIYHCQQMTNNAPSVMSKRCPNLVRFRLFTLDPRKADHVTLDPLDEGFKAIIKSCKGLRRLALSGLILSVAFAGDSDKGMLHVLNGGKKLNKLKIRDSQFGDTTILTNIGKYEAMRYVWMPSFDVTLGGCKNLAKNMPKLNVQIMNENQEKLDDSQKVAELYIYQSLDRPTGGAYPWEG